MIDTVSKQPLAGINVYINNTTIGTLSDSAGMFKLTVPNSAKIELAISRLAFQKQVYCALITTQKLFYNI